MGRLRSGAAALVAMLAVCGLVAQAASATAFKAESYPATISGTQIEGVHSFKTAANELKCNTYDFAGALAEASNELALTGSPSGCSTAGTVVMTVTMNGCTFNFNAGRETGAGRFSGFFHIACPAGREIVWRATNGCTARIPPQTPSSTVTLENTAGEPKKSLKLTTEATGIEYTLENSGFCAGSPPPGLYTNGVYRGVTKLTATNRESASVGLTVD